MYDSQTLGREGTNLQAHVSHEAEASPPERRSFHAIGAAAAAFFVLATLLAAYPAFKAGSNTIPSMLLLMGLAGVAFIGIFAFGSGESKSTEERSLWGEVLDALAEPAAVLSKDGRILRANTAWFDAFGSTRRLPKTPEIGAFYTALTAAKRGDTGRAVLCA